MTARAVFSEGFPIVWPDDPQKRTEMKAQLERLKLDPDGNGVIAWEDLNERLSANSLDAFLKTGSADFEVFMALKPPSDVENPVNEIETAVGALRGAIFLGATAPDFDNKPSFNRFVIKLNKAASEMGAALAKFDQGTQADQQALTHALGLYAEQRSIIERILDQKPPGDLNPHVQKELQKLRGSHQVLTTAIAKLIEGSKPIGREALTPEFKGHCASLCREAMKNHMAVRFARSEVPKEPDKYPHFDMTFENEGANSTCYLMDGRLVLKLEAQIDPPRHPVVQFYDCGPIPARE